MKTFWIVVLISVQVLLGAARGTAAPTIIYDYRTPNPDTDPTNIKWADSYWGGTVNGTNQDVVGTRDIMYQWDITKMQIEEVGTKVQVKIYGPWFGAQNAGWYFTKQDPALSATKPFAGNLYFNLGDLYISSSGWHTTTNSPHYPTDTFNQGEGWDYVITHNNGTICDNFGDFGCYGNVYKLDYTKITTTTTRTNQAFSGGYGEKVEGVSVYVYGYQDPAKPLNESDNSYIMYEFDKFLTGEIGFHHTMNCGNDVIEGEYTMVPEPGTLLLLSFGLLGLAACRRRAKK